MPVQARTGDTDMMRRRLEPTALTGVLAFLNSGRPSDTCQISINTVDIPRDATFNPCAHPALTTYDGMARTVLVSVLLASASPAMAQTDVTYSFSYSQTFGRQ